MSANDLLQDLSWAVFCLLFVLTVAKAIRHPRRTNIDIALFFGVIALVIFISVAAIPAVHLLPSGPLIGEISGSLILALSYLLLRLVDDFADVPRWLLNAAGASWLLLSAGLFVLPLPRPSWLTLLQVLYFVGFQIYPAITFVRESWQSSGVTKRRMQAVATGSVFLGLTVLVSTFTLVLPTLRDLWTLLSRLMGVGAGISYFVGFAPPGTLRRAWQEPELRAFLSQAARLPRLPNTHQIQQELEQGAAASVGAPNARIGLWDEMAQRLRFTQDDEVREYTPGMDTASGRAFLTQRAHFIADVPRESPAYAEESRARGAQAVLAAPITAGAKRLGVLTVYAPRAPIFADDDLQLVQLLADQAAVILESRALIDEATRIRAREEVARLKEDFLSAAAHDLKTPLTTLVAQAQLLERRAARRPEAPTDLAGIRLILQEAQRLKTLVLELLDASRAEQGRLVGEREEVDLVALARDTCERQMSERHPCLLEADSSVVGAYDRLRMIQLIENLIENAVKYTPEGGEIRVKVWREENRAHLTVSDQGIGIPPDDLPHIFDRFYRGANVDDRRFAGMGLGLYICRAIVEQHGGRIWATSIPGQGSTFHVVVPLVPMGVTNYA